MAFSIRRLEPALTLALAKAHNVTVATLVGSSFHNDLLSLTTTDQYISMSAATLQATAANGSDLPSSITLLTQMLGIAKLMMADAISTDPYSAGSHLIPDTTNLPTLTALAPAIDLASSILVANGLKSAINAHFTQAGVHANNDGTNTIGTANATDLPSLITLENVIKTKLNAHIASAPATQMIKVIGP